MGNSVRKKRRFCRKTCDKPHYPFELPEGWCWTTVGEISKSILYGVSESAKSKGEYKLLRITDIQNNAVDWNTVPYTDYDEHRANAYRISDGDILFARTGATVGKSYLVKGLQDKAIYASYLIRVQTFNEILPEYVKYFFESGFYWEQIQKDSVGIGQPNVNGTTLSQLALPIPPINEQHRIVNELGSWLNIIDAIDNGKTELQIAIKRAKSKILDLAIHGKLVPQPPNDEPATELLKRINPNAEITCDNPHYRNRPKGWAVIKVGNVAKYTNGRAFKPEEWESIGLPIIRIQNLNDADAPYNRSSVMHEQKYLIKDGDLLFAWAASIGTYIWSGGNAWLNQHIFKVEPYPFIDKAFLFYAFQAMISEFYKNSHGSGMVHITKKQFEEITLLLPPLSEQIRIVECLEQTFSILDSINCNL
nr:MAG TPA: hypothetical protein [Caudoviricetes sp.]